MEISISVVFLSGLVVGLVEISKKIGLNARFAPLLAVGLGIGLAFLGMPISHVDPFSTLFMGLIAGLSAVGLYSGVKNSAGK